ncbi:MAG: arsenite methyltransferase, partial [Bacteroidota bacterium]
MELNSVKKAVVQSYGKLAKSRKKGLLPKLFGCCDSSSYAKQIGEMIGYSQEEIANLPVEANLGVGCGNPAALARMQAGETVIDLGSGAGFDVFNVSSIVGSRGKVVGIDLSDDMLELARQNARKYQYNNVEFVKGDIEDLPLNDQIADHIISNCVINLSFQKAQVFKEAYRVLKNGGRLSISDIMLEKELPWLIKKSLPAHIACVSGAEKLEDYV